MSQDYHHHQGIYSFSNGFERSSQQEDQHHVAHQIRRDKLRVQGFEPPPPPFVDMVEEEESGGLPVYETAGMLSEMFSFPSCGGVATATELLESQISQSYRNPRTAGGGSAADWFLHRQGMVVGGGGSLGNSKNHDIVNDAATAAATHHQIPNINADSAAAAAMQLFLMNPRQQQRSPSPPPPSSTLHMLLPNQTCSNLHQAFHPASGGGAGASFGQFTTNPTEILGVMEGGQGLSLSLSSSLQQLDAAKAEELRNMEQGGMLFFGSNSANYHHLKNMGSGGGGGLGSPLGAFNILRNSKYAKAAQELLEEFCSVGRGQLKKNKIGRQNSINANPSSNHSGGGGGNCSSSSKDPPPLSAADKVEHQRRKVKLLSMLDEVDRRYSHYCEQMQMVVNSFDIVMGYGAAVPYTCLAQKAMSRHFRCLKDTISVQLKHTYELLGEKDAGTSGITKGETPRLRILEQSLRQQRAFHQMGMMEQEAWRPQRGLPERSVNILRAWLFEHFLHPYPSDADKHLLARQTGLSRNQVSNWFINARVRLWKPMVEEMYQQEAKDETEEGDQSSSSAAGTHTNNHAQTPTPPGGTTTTSTAINHPSQGKRTEINATKRDPSFIAINRHCFPENQTNAAVPDTASSAARQSFPAMHDPNSARRRHATDIGSTLIRFGASAGDVSLTLGLRHAGNLPEKSPFFS